MARRGCSLESATKDLISNITGFQDQDENYQRSWNYVSSNLIFHQFLDVDRHKVEQKVNRLCEVFRLRGRLKDAERFQELVARLLSKHEKSDAIYSVLAFLMRLSRNSNYKDSPENSFESSNLTNIPGDTSEESIEDWKSLLQEDHPMRYAREEDPDYFGDEEDAIESLSIDESPEDDVGQRCDSGIGGTPDSRGTSPPNFPTGRQALSRPTGGHEWLQNHIIPLYWCDQNKCEHLVELSSSASSNQIAADWFRFMDSAHGISRRGSLRISERLVLRETVWMLQGVKETSIFTWKVDHFEPKEDIHISHIAPPTLNCLLWTFCEYGTSLVHLNDFVHMVVNNKHVGLCQTYQAYAEALLDALQSYKEELLRLEKILVQQEATLTVSNFLEEMKWRFEELDLITKVHKEGVEEAPAGDPVWKLSLRLLGTLYRHIRIESMLSSSKLILPLFLKSCRPYLNALDRLITQGHLEDPFSEFVIQRNESVKLLDEHFWFNALAVHDIPEDFSQDFFLVSLLPDIMVAGRSMEMLRHLGHLHEVFKDLTQSGVQGCLFCNFIDNFERLKREGQRSSSEEDFCDKLCLRTVCSRRVVETCDTMVEQCQRIEYNDKLLVINFNRLLNLVSHQSNNPDRGEEAKMIGTRHRHHQQVIHQVIQEALQSAVKPRCRKACQKLVQVLKEDCCLLRHFAVLRNIFLMEAGDLMLEFYSEIFEKLLSKSLCHDEIDLNSLLQSTLAEQNQIHEMERLSITLNPNRREVVDNPLRYLKALQLSYKVPWPVNVVIDSESHNLYSQVFSFLLQLKCAKFSLETLRFSELDRSRTNNISFDGSATSPARELTRQQKIHAMHILRFILLHFVNNVHSYLMTKILHGAHHRLEEEVMQAEHLDDIIQVFLQFRVDLKETCFFQPHFKFIRNGIYMFFQLALCLQQCWRDGVDATKTQQLLKIQQQLNLCHGFLVKYLMTPSMKGCSQMEALNLALLAQSSIPSVVWLP